MQEHYIANILDSLGQPYSQRDGVYFANRGMDDIFYTWDFFLWETPQGKELGMVIQADGANGHGTRYSLSDDVMQYLLPEVKNILHLEAETEDELRAYIIKALDNAEDK